MYVCLCQAVKDSEVRQAVASGVEDVDQLAEALGVGTGCGSCRDFAQSLIDEALDESLAYAA
ncbi:MAG: (2Fe-2S)-binding protein [Gammaproteobacteria bacterium]|nr:(2Fe-2S)-binding protein [Gammaproteobacteria bacterium]MXY56015.1 (2Fe-2S)-binding protein [Gammaproteobacteria bacterium]MYF28783.1 (2Fe-2S)-binding protein [Gammaproteobacteria bacterium]MYK46799.1 (2Fe-2S)-binding protein [Gammaproteobacteria bacterium]